MGMVNMARSRPQGGEATRAAKVGGNSCALRRIVACGSWCAREDWEFCLFVALFVRSFACLLARSFA